jgi:transposase
MKERLANTLPKLNEYQRKIYLAAEAKAIGYGGISLVSRELGVSRRTLTEGVKELENPNAKVIEQGRSRKPGGGRKPIWESYPGILEELKELVTAHTKGDPMSSLTWTNKSLRTLQRELKPKGYEVSHRIVGIMLKKLGYSLQANKKTLTTTQSHPDRDAQFEHINSETRKAIEAGNPVLSIDAKKKEKVGNFKNNGKTYQEQKTPVEVLDHDFPIPELGKATPYGVYDIFRNQGFVNVGISADTAMFAVESLRRWWQAEGSITYRNAQEIVITADCGGSNGNRSRLWKREIQEFANEIGKPIKILHYPPGTSKWNKIEHRLFSFISINWQGIPLISTAIILSLIGATTTKTGLAVTCMLDENTYEKGLKVSDGELSAINITPHEFHGEWNYTINPDTT